MCMGGGGDASKALDEQQNRRASAIKEGQSNINRVFSQFNPGFYNQVKENTVNTLMPQAFRQYKGARNQLGYSMAGRGLMKSSAAREAATNLEADREVAQESVINQGEEAARDTQRQVQTQKVNLTNQLVTSQDPALAAQQAIGAAASIHAPSPIAPLGNLFSTFANTYLANQVAKTYNQPATSGSPRFSLGTSNRVQN